MGVTLEEVAARANLNKGSVSRILNGKGEGYSDQTRQRVLQTAVEMGYQPNMLARALWTGSTNIISLWLLAHDSYSPYFGYVHHCLQRLGIQHGYHLITEDVPLPGPDQAETAQPVRWPVDGVLAFDLSHVAAEYMYSKTGTRSPLVCLGQGPEKDRTPARIPATDYVFLDLSAGSREATEHLIASGARRIAYVSLKKSASEILSYETRVATYVDVMNEAGRETEFVAVAETTRQGGYDALKDYVARNGCPDALFCANDEVAIGCYMALHELGIRIPDDVLLVGFDGLENARFFPCPISSVVIPIEEMCTLAWEMLVGRIKDPQAPLKQQTLVPRLEIRASSRR